MRRAQVALDMFEKQGTPAEVHFTYTCEKCGTRCTLSEPNMLRENGECCVCGHTTTITEGGFTLIANLHSTRVRP